MQIYTSGEGKAGNSLHAVIQGLKMMEVLPLTQCGFLDVSGHLFQTGI